MLQVLADEWAKLASLVMMDLYNFAERWEDDDEDHEERKEGTQHRLMSLAMARKGCNGGQPGEHQPDRSNRVAVTT